MRKPRTLRQRLFVEYYLGDANGNAAEAARRAGYSVNSARVLGPRLLTKPAIAAAIAARVSEVGMSAPEVLGRMSDIAAGTLEDFIEIGEDGGWRLNLSKAKRRGCLHLLKKLKVGQYGTEIELHDVQGALEKLGQYHGLWSRPPTLDEAISSIQVNFRRAEIRPTTDARSPTGGGD